MLLNFMNVETYEECGTRYTYYSLLVPSYNDADTSLYIINHLNESLTIFNNSEDDLFEFLNNPKFEEVDISFNYSNPNSDDYIVNKSDFKKWVLEYSNDSEIPLSKALRNAVMDM